MRPVWLIPGPAAGSMPHDPEPEGRRGSLAAKELRTEPESSHVLKQSEFGPLAAIQFILHVAQGIPDRVSLAVTGREVCFHFANGDMRAEASLFVSTHRFDLNHYSHFVPFPFRKAIITAELDISK
jgi:hypothetical protein